MPAVTGLAASGAATINVHIIRNADGTVQSGSVDFEVNYTFPGAVTIVGMHIHDGEAGGNGPVRIDSGISGTATVVSESGRGFLSLRAQVLPTNTAGLATLDGLFRNPSRHYLNLHTTVNPGGAIRGQVERPPTNVALGIMRPSNEVPAITGLNASAAAAVIVKYTQDAAGNLTSAEAVFDVTYDFPAQVTFTGLHVHKGRPGENGPVTLNSGLTQQLSHPTGKGFLSFRIEAPLTNEAAVNTIVDLFTNPADYYINLHTTDHPGGAVRATLRPTGIISYPFRLSPANEVPAVTGIDGSGVGELRIRVSRAPNGDIEVAHLRFDINHRLPGRVTFTGLHVHDGAAGNNGPVRIDCGLSATNSIVSESGFGNVFERVTFSDAAGLATLNSLLGNPERHYVNLHTTEHPGGLLRGQVGAPPQAAAITAVVSAVPDRALTAVAPANLFTIFGSNLSRTTGGLEGWQGETIPSAYNGVRVTVGGRAAPILYTSAGQINAQVPVDTPAGTQPVVVTVGGAASPAANVTVGAVAPAIFFFTGGGIVVKTDFSLVSPQNPARAGDVLIVYATGLGQTTPAMETGRLVTFPPASNTAPVTVSIGGREAEVIYSIAAPGFAGLYQVAVRMPAGVAAGNAAVVLRSGNASSNSVNIAAQ